MTQRSCASRKRAKQRSKRNLRLALDGRSGPVSSRKATAEDLARFHDSHTPQRADGSLRRGQSADGETTRAVKEGTTDDAA